ncbi:MAG TPA: hypothetical protein PKA90_12465 [Ignavibacteria bacterium]|nr:hypothetical protein [Ignavibacteria bacterium]HMR41232.1 hypothetical protein [Ignavibacteria bacterium]
MTGNTLISKRIQEVLIDGKWIADTNFKEHILNLNWEQANHKTDGLNSIAMLTFHMNYYMKGILSVLDGGMFEISDK